MPPLDPTRITTYARTFASADLQHRVEQFLYLEAELLDDRKVGEWVAVLHRDVHYSMQIQQRDGENASPGEPTVSSKEQAIAFDDDKGALELRAREFERSFDITRAPRVTTRRSISNVRVKPGDTEDTYKVRSNFVLLLHGPDAEPHIVSGTRFDVLRRSDGEIGFEIARRWIVADDTLRVDENVVPFL